MLGFGLSDCCVAGAAAVSFAAGGVEFGSGVQASAASAALAATAN